MAAAWDAPEDLAFVEKFKAKYRETPNITPTCIGTTVHLRPRPSKAAGSADRAKVRDALSKIKYDSAMGEVTFDDHIRPPANDPAQIETGKAGHQGPTRAKSNIPPSKQQVNPREE